jgi:hypothetical protein
MSVTAARLVTSMASASASGPSACDAVLVDVAADDVGAFAREDQRSGAADAARRAGDDDRLAFEVVRRLRHRRL